MDRLGKATFTCFALSRVLNHTKHACFAAGEAIGIVWHVAGRRCRFVFDLTRQHESEKRDPTTLPDCRYRCEIAS